jgi:ubiquinol-cytochrome c reductase cytochrome c1 subunit
LVDVAYTEEEMKAIAADVEVQDGPNDQGEMYDRPGKLADHIPPPYPNEQAARAANNGAYPVDLSLIVKARPGEDYIFSLLTGYREPPAGVDVKNGMYYNPYFNGGQIGMGQQLNNDMIEYEDGTDASASQLAKDVTTFLSWAAEPHQDEHKRFGVKAVFLLSLTAVQLLYWKRLKWSIIKNRRVTFL